MDLAYETWGTLSPARDNAVFLTTGLSPGSHAASTPENPEEGWWEDMIGPGKAFDTNRFFVICANSFGSCKGSTGAASIDPRTGTRYGTSFPTLTVEDIAITAHALVRGLGIETLHAVAGSSLGGMTSLAYGVLFPEDVARVVTISAAAHATPYAIALRSIQREAIRRDPAFRGGAYDPLAPPLDGMRIARKIGTVTYRSAIEWDERFGRRPAEAPSAEPGAARFAVEDYLDRQAEKFVGTFDANCWLALSEAMDAFDLANHGGSVLAAAHRLRGRRVLVVGVETDILFPIRQQAELAVDLAAGGARVDFARLPSVQGHDAFLVDLERFEPAVKRFLES